MREVEIRWIDVANKERIFITAICMAENNLHAIQQAIINLRNMFGDEILEIEKIEVVEY